MDAKETSGALFRLMRETVGGCPSSTRTSKNRTVRVFPGISPIVRQIPGLAFFPGGDGLWKEHGQSEPTDRNPRTVMAVGSTFGCLDYFNKLTKMSFPEENHGRDTWGRLHPFLGDIKYRCFFTNAFPGLLNSGENIDNELRPAEFDAVYLNECRDFFSKQVELTKPKAILFLGKYSPFVIGEDRLNDLGWSKFLNHKLGSLREFKKIDEAEKSFISGIRWPGVSEDIGIALLVHPSYRHRNCNRQGLKYPGPDPELHFLRHIMRTTHPGETFK